MSTVAHLDSLLEHHPDVCGGRMCLAGTRLTVLQVAMSYKRGETPEEMSLNWPQASLSQIYAALAWYHANQAELEQQLVDELADFDRLRQQHISAVKHP